jgi:hypothetical protein
MRAISFIAVVIKERMVQIAAESCVFEAIRQMNLAFIAVNANSGEEVAEHVGDLQLR